MRRFSGRAVGLATMPVPGFYPPTGFWCAAAEVCRCREMREEKMTTAYEGAARDSRIGGRVSEIDKKPRVLISAFYKFTLLLFFRIVLNSLKTFIRK